VGKNSPIISSTEPKRKGQLRVDADGHGVRVKNYSMIPKHIYELVFSPCNEGQEGAVKLESNVYVSLYEFGNYWSFTFALSPFSV
jgi:hypothetical protein